MSPSLFYETQVVPSVVGGNIYGKAGETVASLIINGGTFYCEKGIFAGGRGTEKFYSENAYSGTPSDYTALGKTYGNVDVSINGGTIYGNVYGGGAGVAEAKLKNTSTYNPLTEMARLTGNTRVNIGGTAQILSSNGNGGNVYGGGMLAAVDGTATVNLSGNAVIEGNVYGAAQGITSDLLHTPENAPLFGIVNGNTYVTSTGNPSVQGDIYGGAESAITNGNTSIDNIEKAGNVQIVSKSMNTCTYNVSYQRKYQARTYEDGNEVPKWEDRMFTATLLLTFNDNNQCTITSLTDGITATGSGTWTDDGAKKSWNNKDRELLELNYSIPDFGVDDYGNTVEGANTHEMMVWLRSGVSLTGASKEFSPVYTK